MLVCGSVPFLNIMMSSEVAPQPQKQNTTSHLKCIGSIAYLRQSVPVGRNFVKLENYKLNIMILQICMKT